MTPVAMTARWTAAARAREARAPAPLFHDPYAEPLAGPEGFALLDMMQKLRTGGSSGEPDPYLSIRTRFFDDVLERAVHQSSLRQVVLVASGMDMRAFRLPWPDEVRLFEVDQAEVFEHKEQVLQHLVAQPTCTRVLVEANLKEGWVEALCAAGFQSELPAAFLVEGLFVYLEEQAATDLLRALQGVAAPGSWFGADLVSPELLSSPYLRAFLDKLVELGCPWRFGTAQPDRLLATYGWDATITQPGETGANFGRWPWPVLPPNVPGWPRSYLVTAQRRG